MIDLRRLARATAAFARTYREQTRDYRRFRRNRQIITALCSAGIADSTYLLLYQTGRISHLVCPFFGKACDRISSSRTAHPFGIPDAIFGVIGYGALLGLNLAGNTGRLRTRPELPLLCFAGGATAFALSIVLVRRQQTEFHTYCFWCLTSAAISTTIFPLTWPEARATRRHLAESRQTAAPVTADRISPRRRTA